MLILLISIVVKYLTLDTCDYSKRNCEKYDACYWFNDSCHNNQASSCYLYDESDVSCKKDSLCMWEEKNLECVSKKKEKESYVSIIIVSILVPYTLLVFLAIIVVCLFMRRKLCFKRKKKDEDKDILTFASDEEDLIECPNCVGNFLNLRSVRNLKSVWQTYPLNYKFSVVLTLIFAVMAVIYLIIGLVCVERFYPVGYIAPLYFFTSGFLFLLMIIYFLAFWCYTDYEHVHAILTLISFVVILTLFFMSLVSAITVKASNKIIFGAFELEYTKYDDQFFKENLESVESFSNLIENGPSSMVGFAVVSVVLIGLLLFLVFVHCCCYTLNSWKVSMRGVVILFVPTFQFIISLSCIYVLTNVLLKSHGKNHEDVQNLIEEGGGGNDQFLLKGLNMILFLVCGPSLFVFVFVLIVLFVTHSGKFHSGEYSINSYFDGIVYAKPLFEFDPSKLKVVILISIVGAIHGLIGVLLIVVIVGCSGGDFFEETSRFFYQCSMIIPSVSNIDFPIACISESSSFSLSSIISNTTSQVDQNHNIITTFNASSFIPQKVQHPNHTLSYSSDYYDYNRYMYVDEDFVGACTAATSSVLLFNERSHYNTCKVFNLGAIGYRISQILVEIKDVSNRMCRFIIIFNLVLSVLGFPAFVFIGCLPPFLCCGLIVYGCRRQT